MLGFLREKHRYAGCRKQCAEEQESKHTLHEPGE
jgi:hypothetical protein